MEDAVVRSFWHGPALGLINRLCLSSFAQAGFRVELFSYAPVEGLPRGVIARDAAEILPCDHVFRYQRGDGAGSPSLHSNLFRYKMLHDLGGWWIDTDVLRLRSPIPTNEEYVFSWEPEMEVVGTAVLAAPAGCELMRSAFEAAQTLIDSEPDWSVTGPNLLTKFIGEFGLGSHVKPASFAYELGYLEAQKFLRPDDYEEVVRRTHSSPFAHLWEMMFKVHQLPIEMLPPAGSFLDEQIKLHGIGARDSGRPSASELDAIWQKADEVKALTRETAKKHDGLMAEIHFRVNSGERIFVPLIVFQKGTGEQSGGAIECIPEKHSAGHCLFGADFEVSIEGVYRVTFEVERLGDLQRDDDLVFDVYENSERSFILAQADLRHTHPTSRLRQAVRLDFVAEEGFRVEFRAFWRGASPIRIVGAYLEQISSVGNPFVSR